MKQKKLIDKIKKQSPQFTEEQVVQIARFLRTLSELYYQSESKSNPKKKAA